MESSKDHVMLKKKYKAPSKFYNIPEIADFKSFSGIFNRNQENPSSLFTVFFSSCIKSPDKDIKETPPP